MSQDRQFNTEKWQRVYQYLSHFHENNGSMDKFKFCNTNVSTSNLHGQNILLTEFESIKSFSHSIREYLRSIPLLLINFCIVQITN